MPSLKPLRSVAHNLAHQFASTLNYWSDDYAINRLARAAVLANEPVVIIDVLGQSMEPRSVQVGVVIEFVPALKRTLEDLLKKEGMKAIALSAAKLEFNFGANKLAPPRERAACQSTNASALSKRLKARGLKLV